jgi:hypothetical protein
MPHKKPIETVEREALCAVKVWRHADKQAIADKAKQRTEYQERMKLRTAADALQEAHHG